MPAATRDCAASSASAYSRCRSRGTPAAITSASAAEMQAVFDGYDGKLGSGMESRTAGSACDGRSSQYAYFASLQATSASYAAALASARSRAARRSS
jgi:hypothetical protein